MNAEERERSRAHARLGAWLNHAVRVVLVLGLVAWLVPGTVGRVAGWTVVALLIAAPVARVVWFAVRWWDRDRRFVPVAAALVATLGIAAVATALLGR